MVNQMKTDFNDEIVLGYDENIARVVPGYALMTSVAVAHCQSHLSDGARLLIVGAGTGNELEQLCLANPTWAFTAVEPAEAMLKQAKARCRAHDDRIHYHLGTLDSLETTTSYDACVCLLVIHFLPEAEKRKLLMQIATVTTGHLSSHKKNAHPMLLLSQRLLIDNEPFLDSEIIHALSRGHPVEKREMLRNRLLDLPTMSDSQARDLYQQCGFHKAQTLLQVFSYQLVSLQVENE